jgi:ubiquinone/menaquinone biosynthesis C-methylase UbiE
MIQGCCRNVRRVRTDPVEMHYSRGNLMEMIDVGLAESGLDPTRLEADTLAPFEEFHTFGRAATLALADAVELCKADRVLDVGSGIGGAARVLARDFGCHVTGVDLTDEFCHVARELNRRVGLDEQIEIRRGDAIDLPFVDGEFSVVWTQHVSMNVADKQRLYGEMRRVVPPGGRLAFFDILAGPTQPIHFPVPWATDERVSFLASALETQAIIASAGFRTQLWDDVTEEAIEFYKAAGTARPEGRPPLGMHIVIPNIAEKFVNLKRNAEEGRIIVVRCVAEAVA